MSSSFDNVYYLLARLALPCVSTQYHNSLHLRFLCPLFVSFPLSKGTTDHSANRERAMSPVGGVKAMSQPKSCQWLKACPVLGTDELHVISIQNKSNSNQLQYFEKCVITLQLLSGNIQNNTSAADWLYV